MPPQPIVGGGIKIHHIKRTIACIDRESGYYEFLVKFEKKLNFTNFTEFLKCALNFILKFSTLILTEKLQSHFCVITETLYSDKSDSNHCYSKLESVTLHSPLFPFNSCFNIVHSLSVLQQFVQNLKICRRENVIQIYTLTICH